jgi:tRNA isopentenyl-2-thiomethyl-A-37 hydroxylase MiaE
MAFKLKTLFMGSDGTVPEQYARTTEKKNLTAWIVEGLIEHRSAEKIYALTPKGENSIK